ncbi:hypothetical protein GCM10009550_38170 [Actinocorallia libanotica]|uniref:Uncharacterized protein n=1 Tax=Actinocorallia libanotica TaxID=46162 RepID=A0ABN1RC03_9ACTN
MADIDIHDFTERYVAVWNGSDAECRRAAIRELCSADAVHVLQPPKEILQTVEGLGFGSAPGEGQNRVLQFLGQGSTDRVLQTAAGQQCEEGMGAAAGTGAHQHPPPARRG